VSRNEWKPPFSGEFAEHDLWQWIPEGEQPSDGQVWKEATLQVLGDDGQPAPLCVWMRHVVHGKVPQGANLFSVKGRYRMIAGERRTSRPAGACLGWGSGV
jgi:hypothetical protein